jgi:hypothetical protein
MDALARVAKGEAAATLARLICMTDLSPHLAEYEKLKEEQGQRIHFRDNMRYVTLVAAGFVFAKASDMPFALLAIPWVSCVLGWTYVANSRRVYSIRQYLETKLAAKVGAQSFEWEQEHQNDRRRRILIDEITFVGPGLIALIAFSILPDAHVGPAWLLWLAWVLVAVEAAFLVWIGWEIAHPRASKGLPFWTTEDGKRPIGARVDADRQRVAVLSRA